MLSKNQPINPCKIHTYLAAPVVGIVPKPRVTKLLRLSVIALITLIEKPTSNVIKGLNLPLSIKYYSNCLQVVLTKLMFAAQFN